mgnify:CR=1 FL=1
MIVDFHHHYTPRELIKEDPGDKLIVRFDENGAPSYTVHSLLYAGEKFLGTNTEVFAFYASPITLGASCKPGTKFPGVVLIHGGGGTAFADWAYLWAKRGYAAIAMDLAGHGPAGRLPDGGPDQSDETKFKDFTGDAVKDMWSYHAVAAVIRGHSLLAAQPAVDRNRIGLTGISWGGYLTCLVASLDDRLKVAVPVYGCGFLAENSVWTEPRFVPMSPEQRQRWTTEFDPASYLAQVRCPILFLNGTNDFAYPADSYAKCFDLVKAPKWMSMQVRLPHGHIWNFPEVDAFIDSPVGSAPDAMAQLEYAGEPPCAAIVVLYATLTSALGTLAVEIDRPLPM